MTADEVSNRAWSDVPLFHMEVDPGPPAPSKRTKKVDTREFGGWTLDKLTTLEKYFKGYRRVAGSGTYIDAFAGDGAAVIRGRTVDGSPLIALQSGAFKFLHFIELDGNKFSRLSASISNDKKADRCSLHEGDCNSVILELLKCKSISTDRPCFAFLDPNSTQLAWSTIEALAGYKQLDEATKACKIELWVLFNEQQAIQRLWPRDKSAEPPFASTLDFVMGGRDAWIDLWKEGRGPQWLVHRYRERLRGLGYRKVNMQQIKDPTSGRPQYWMLHASDHDAAMTWMKWAKRSSNVVSETESLPGLGLDD